MLTWRSFSDEYIRKVMSDYDISICPGILGRYPNVFPVPIFPSIVSHNPYPLLISGKPNPIANNPQIHKPRPQIIKPRKRPIPPQHSGVVSPSLFLTKPRKRKRSRVIQKWVPKASSKSAGPSSSSLSTSLREYAPENGIGGISSP